MKDPKLDPAKILQERPKHQQTNQEQQQQPLVPIKITSELKNIRQNKQDHRPASSTSSPVKIVNRIN